MIVLPVFPMDISRRYWSCRLQSPPRSLGEYEAGVLNTLLKLHTHSRQNFNSGKVRRAISVLPPTSMADMGNYNSLAELDIWLSVVCLLFGLQFNHCYCMLGLSIIQLISEFVGVVVNAGMLNVTN